MSPLTKLTYVLPHRLLSRLALWVARRVFARLRPGFADLV